VLSVLFLTFGVVYPYSEFVTRISCKAVCWAVPRQGRRGLVLSDDVVAGEGGKLRPEIDIGAFRARCKAWV